MSPISRRAVLGAAASALALGATAGCKQTQGSSGIGAASEAPTNPPDSTPSAAPGPSHTVTPGSTVQLIGDGSTADTGPQPNQPTPGKLQPGEAPPQFVVFSWDGAGELNDQLFSRFRALATQYNASMTFFLSGIYALPAAKKTLYAPPQHPVGASAIGYLSDAHVHATLQQVRLAWLDGHEIGTHFNGHFCGPTGVSRWSADEWHSEIRQAVQFVSQWKTNTGFTDLQPLPFDYTKELTGSRTPCLEGRGNLLPAAAELGWAYDASSPGGLQTWPTKVHNSTIWDFPLQSIPFPGHSFEVLSMDYNMMANQSNGSPNGDRSKRSFWRTQAHQSYLAGFNRAYQTNRAPFFIGNHFETWNGGIYMDAVESALGEIAGHPDVRLVSFRQLVHWLEAQDPAVLAKLRTLDPGQAPRGGWQEFLAST